MKNSREDWLRPEYTRADFGEMLQGKYATTQLDFAEVADLLVACIGEDENLTFTRHSAGNYLAGHKPGDWTYEVDNANQITLRYWINEFRSIEEQISNPSCITTPQREIRTSESFPYPCAQVESQRWCALRLKS